MKYVIKHISLITLICFMVFTLSQFGLIAAQDNVTIILSIGSPGMTVNMSLAEIDPGRPDTVPVIINDRTLLPIRAVIEAIGGEIGWEDSIKEVSILVDENSIKLSMLNPVYKENFVFINDSMPMQKIGVYEGSKYMNVNGEMIKNDVPAMIINSRTFMPLRFIAENAGCAVKWEPSNRSVIVTYTGGGPVAVITPTPPVVTTVTPPITITGVESPTPSLPAVTTMTPPVTTTVAESPTPTEDPNKINGVIVPEFNEANVYNVKDFGAKGDGDTNDSDAIMDAINQCNADGGGIVQFPSGDYIIASVWLKSNVQLKLEEGTTLVGASDGYDPAEPNEFDMYQDFGHSHFHNAMICGDSLENIAIIGPGKIDGGGIERGEVSDGKGDKQIALTRCENVLFDGLEQINSGHFFYLLNTCSHITMRNMDMTGGSEGRDGIDLMGCKNVNIHDSSIVDMRDDAIGIKNDYALGVRELTQNVNVWNCTVESQCNGIQFGSETAGDFKDIHYKDITILKGSKSGIGLQTNDGGTIDGVTYENITMTNAATPIYINTTGREYEGGKFRTPEDVTYGTIKNIHFKNITATECTLTKEKEKQKGIVISGRPDFYHENITFENVNITYMTEGSASDVDVEVPYVDENYNPRIYQKVPSYGLYARHAKNIKLINVTFSFETNDDRPAIFCFDIQGLEIDNLTAQKGEKAESTIVLKDVSNFVLTNSQGLADVNEPTITEGSY